MGVITKAALSIDRIKKDGEETSRWYKTIFLHGNYSKYHAMAIARDTTNGVSD